MDKDESILIPLEIITISVEDFDDFTRECVPKEMQKKFYIAKKEGGKEYCSYDELIILFDVIKNYYIKGRVVERKIILCYANWMKEYVEKDMLSFYYEIGREFMEWLDSYQKRLT